MDVEEGFGIVCRQNDADILSGTPIVTKILFIKGAQSKEHTIKLTMKNKDAVQERVKALAIKEGVDGYIIVVDSKLRFIRQFVGPEKVREKVINHDKSCVVRSLFMPKKKLTEIVAYKDGIIVDKRIVTDRDTSIDGWDAWNSLEMETVHNRVRGG